LQLLSTKGMNLETRNLGKEIWFLLVSWLPDFVLL